VLAIAALGCGGSKGASPQDGGTMMDTGAPPTDAFTASMIPAGEQFCQQTNAGEMLWQQGYETTCIVTAADNPPLTAAQKQAADTACSFQQPGIVPNCPPRSDVIAFCAGGLPAGGTGTQSWMLVYKSSVTPDVDALSLGTGGPYCPEGMYDLNGRKIDARPCAGSLTARINGVMKSFNVHLGCAWKSDGTRSRYQLSGYSTDGSPYDRLDLAVIKSGSTVGFDRNDIGQTGGAYYQGSDGSGGPFTSSQPSINATTFLDRGGGLVATFSLGTSDATAGGTTATITDGTVDIRILPAP
jgi:hypothetical protein